MAGLPAFTWDVQLRRYRDSGGRLVAQTSVRAALDQALADQGRIVRTLSEGHRAGRISLNEWALGMRTVVKDTQLFSAAVAKGGWGQLDAGDFGRVGQAVRQQYGFLADFRAKLEAGMPRDGNFLQYAVSYAKAGKPTYLSIRADDVQGAGFDQVRSITHAGQHCAECLAEEAKGFQPIGAMKPIGQRECLTNDNCTAEFRNSSTGEVMAA